MKLRLMISLLLGVSGSVAAVEGYYRSPDIHGENASQQTLVFTAEGDLWLSQLNSKQPARRLTTHPAEEKQATISPDGQQVAFLADYEGVPEVYVIPIQGGVAKRVSFENALVRVQGWTP